MLKHFLLLLILFIGINIFGQNQTKPEYLVPDKNMVVKVKQFNQFINRFNYTENFEGNPVDSMFQKKMPRKNYLAYLFNQSDFRLSRTQQGDDGYTNRIGIFIHEVVSNSQTIARASENIFVLAKCKIKYKGNDETLELVLRQKKLGGGLAWVIYDVYNPGFLDVAFKNNTDVFMPPTSNEINFTHLKRAFENKQNFEKYFDISYDNNSLVKLRYAVENNEIEFFHVEKMSYFVFDIVGWVMVIEEYNRNQMNSGWLISELVKWDKNPSEFFRQK